jgi:hypothetical protein
MFKWLFKWMFRLVLLVVVLFVLFIAFKDSIYATLAENRIRGRTGMDVQIGSFSSSLFSSAVTIKNLKLYNTAEFGGTLFVDVPELHIELDSISLAQRKLRFNLVRFNLAELDIVRNEAGKTNIFAMIEKAESDAKGKKEDRFRKLLGDLQFDGIDVLNLSLGKAKFIDLKDASQNREIHVDMQNQIFKQVNSEADVYGMLFMIWLRSGGKLSLSPNDLAKDYLNRKGEKVEKVVKQVLEKPAEPPRKQ